jgi:NitT/TauT family transport system substrate-binding protein
MTMDLKPRVRGLLAVLTVAALALGVTACGNGGSDTTDSSGDTTAEASTPTKLSVATLPIANAMPLYYGVENGIFEKHGLDVSITEVGTSADGIAAAVSGDSPIAYSGITSLITGVAEGLPLKAIANATLYAPGTSGIVATKDSGITEPADLNGKTIAVSGLKAQTDLFLRAAGDALGADSTTFKVIAVPFPEMPAALESGQVDAAWLVVPFYTGALAAGGVSVLDEPIEPVFGSIENVSQDVYVATDEFIESDGETVDAFRAAIEEATEFIEDNPDVIPPTLASYTAFNEKEAAELPQPIFSPLLDTEVNQQWADTMLEYEFVAEPVTLADHVELGE